MIFTIQSSDSILDLKNRFTDSFPGLKIEFFSKHHDEQEGSPKKEMINGKVHIAEVNPELDQVKFIIEPHMKVSELEENFFQSAKLNVQVFRKMGPVWLETVQTDNYSLEEQMKLSAEAR